MPKDVKFYTDKMMRTTQDKKDTKIKMRLFQIMFYKNGL